MQNKVQDDTKLLEVTAPADVLSGEGVQVGAIFGVAITDALAGERVAIERRAVVTLPKLTGLVVNAGDALYWDNGAKVVTKTPAGKILIGAAPEAVGAGPVLVDVALDGSASITF